MEEEEKAFTGRPRMTRKAMQEGQSRLRMLSDSDSYTVSTSHHVLIFFRCCALSFSPTCVRHTLPSFSFLNENALVIF